MGFTPKPVFGKIKLGFLMELLGKSALFSAVALSLDNVSQNSDFLIM
jgi:hypothetical protein